jgi:hypothetical protein
VTSPVTYGELMTRAARHCAVGWAHHSRQPLADAEEAHQTLTTFTDLVYALARHARHLAGAQRWSHAVRFNPDTDPLMLAAARFSAALGAATVGNRPRRSRPIAEGSLPVHLRAATVAIRTATDLLETHRAVDGRWRTPESPILDDLHTRLTALDDVAKIAIRLADIRPTLLKDVHAAGVTVPWLRTHPLPELAAVRDTARDLHTLAIHHGRATVITNAVAAHSTIRTDEPLVEISDRLARMRTAAWTNATYPSTDGGIPALTTFATTAITVHGTAALGAARLADTRLADPQAPNLVTILLARAELWRRIRVHLLRLDSPSRLDTTLAEDGRAVCGLLAALMPPTSRAAEPNAPADRGKQPASRELQPRSVAALATAAGMFEEIAEWNASTLRSLDASGQILVPNWVLRGATRLARTRGWASHQR